MIDLCNVNAIAPYKLKKVTESVYEFSTDQGVLYRLGFLDDESIVSCKTYQFYISKLTPNKSRRDAKIRPTIIAFIESFFDINGSVLLYMCDTDDGRQELRSKLFLRWFNTSDNRNKYLCRDTHITVEGIKMFAAIIIRRDNPLLQDVEEEFEEATKLLSNGK